MINFGFIIRRMLMFTIVLFGLTSLVFALSYIVPGDPFATLMAQNVSPDVIEKLRQRYGLDKPLYEQYVIYMKNLFHGDLGYSWRHHRSVAKELVDRLPATFELGTFALILSIIIGIPIGIYVSTRRNKASDHFVRALSLVGVSAPAFWIGLIFLLMFYEYLGLVGPGRIDVNAVPPTHITGFYLIDSLITGNFPIFIDSFKHIILPALVLAFPIIALLCRMTRACMLEVLTQDYIVAARSRGLTERIIIYKHALKNALIPVTTIIGLAYGGLLGGSVIVETIFNWPGMGWFALDSLISLDTPCIMGFTLIAGVIYSIINLFVDILYSFINPRITYG